MTDAANGQENLKTDYAGTMQPLFGLVMLTTFFTVITLGIYRFWMRTRLRRYYWSAIRPGDAPLEYTGTGLEKLLGFFIAVVFLAIYLGILQLFLSFIGLSFFSGNQQMAAFGIQISSLAVIPLIYFAQYRARRYMLSRTRWRGVRFGMDQAGVKYAFYAIGQTLITLITLGILYPRQVFNLEKFRTERTWYGDLKLRQGGTWKMLMRPWLAVYGMLIAGAALIAMGVQSNSIAFIVFGFLVIYIGGAVTYVSFGVNAFRQLTGEKSAGEAIGFKSDARTRSVLQIYVLGGLVIGLIFAVAITIVAMTLQTSVRIDLNLMNALTSITSLIIYLVAILGVGALSHVFIIQPLMRHYATTLMVLNANELEDVGQRPQDQNVEAGGFADALDVGAAI